MTFEHAKQFFVESHFRVMLFLVLNVTDRVVHLRDTYAKCGITVLPCERAILEVIVDPLEDPPLIS